ncbi:MAG: sodium:alanine symporter family protein, partial [Ignavibacteriaceae bacterium]|nr:sodium:alanine symporter family protein [Ignavibacteriaceae bacterium]
MKRSTSGIIFFTIIILLIVIAGFSFFDIVWSFPGNFDFIKNLPTPDIPIGSIPFMIIVLVGTGIFISIKLGFPQLRYLWHGIKVTMGKYDDPNDEGDLNHF